MGTWDHGLFDNDTAFDGLAELRDSLVGDIIRRGAARPGPQATARLAASVGLLHQLAPETFAQDDSDRRPIVAALRAHERALPTLSPAARRALRKIQAGEAVSARARLGARLRAALQAEGDTVLFGRRFAALFDAPAAEAQVLACERRCVAKVREDFADEDNWSDLCREGYGVAALAFLLVLAPLRVPAGTIEGWRRKAARGLARLRAEPDEELGFHERYYANLERVFRALLRRVAAV